jgi:PPK2 family polyphosphate:nucleotide phosphotransferase
VVDEFPRYLHCDREMKEKKIIEDSRELAKPFRITKGKNFRLKDFDPAETGNFKPEDKARIKEALENGIQMLARLQDILYAQDRWAVLLVVQAMDAAGKDGVIKHVMSGVNPQGCQVYSFKNPSAIELDHDYLWRCNKCLPQRGHIGVFNRSYYEETLIVRVHPELLNQERIPKTLVTENLWDNRFHDIRSFERYLSRNGTVIRKFFLNVSADEQKRRFLERLDNPVKNWKFSESDIRERAFWKKYRRAYQEMIKNTASPYAPWYVVPADNKWFTRLIVAGVIVETLASLHLKYPEVTAEQHKALLAAKKTLLAER